MSAGDVVIAGGGALGSSVACHLVSDPDFRGRVLVVEKDPTYRLAASALSAASIRQQFSQPVNIRISRYGVAFLRQAADQLADGDDPADVGLHEAGYLYLADAGGADVLRANHVVQSREGADIVLLGPGELSNRFLWLETGDLALGALGLSGEGWFDGWGLLQGLRRAARHRGATFLADEVVGLTVEGGRVVAVRLRSGDRIPCAAFVNCAGANGRAVAAMAGIDLPVHAKRRSVFSFSCRTTLPRAPLLIDTSGVWMRPEGRPGPEGTFIAGWSPPPEDDPDWHDEDAASQEVDWPIFEDTIWPALAARVPALAAIKPGRAWTGPYDMNIVDQNALVGPSVEIENLFLCNGFSGHGLQQAPAVGRGLAELIVHGSYKTVDLGDLSPARLRAGRPLREHNVI